MYRTLQNLGKTEKPVLLGGNPRSAHEKQGEAGDDQSNDGVQDFADHFWSEHAEREQVTGKTYHADDGREQRQGPQLQQGAKTVECICLFYVIEAEKRDG